MRAIGSSAHAGTIGDHRQCHRWCALGAVIADNTQSQKCDREDEH